MTKQRIHYLNKCQGCTEHIVAIAGALLICSAIYIVSRNTQAKLGGPILAAIGLAIAIVGCVLFVLVLIAVSGYRAARSMLVLESCVFRPRCQVRTNH